MTEPLEGIAIIGLAGRFPGARNVAEYWRNLLAGAETISTINGEPPVGSVTYVPRRGLIEKPEWFDATFFGMSPREAEVTDPQQRVFLEECWTALEDAGCDPKRYTGAIGVYAGMSNNTYWAQNVVHHPELIESVGALTAMMGNEKDYLATRVAYKLNLRGPALNIYTACSTSLVAVCQAVQALLNYNCDVALAGGISLKFPYETGYEFDEGGILSPDGHCRPFDVNSGGTVFSNGVGVVALKRLADAVEDGDQIYAVIKGAALNNDGSDKVSFTAPSVEGHAGVIALAHALADIDPRTIGYIEAHGTGTSLGDPIEIAGLTQAFRAHTNDTGFCAIGSVKSNIGHLDAAAGIAGLIKSALSIRNGKIPPSLHFTAPNPALELGTSPFFVAAQVLDWPVSEGPRRCGVSSFGVGGTNAHCILEQFAQDAGTSDSESGATPQILPLSAKSESALAQAATNLADHLIAHPEQSFGHVAATLQAGRSAFGHRRAIVAHNRESAISALRGSETKHTFAGEAHTSGVVFMFPGQGAQFAGMGSSLYRSGSAYRDAIDECCSLLAPALGLDLRTLLHPSEQDRERANTALRETRYTQPALFVVSYAIARLWMSWGITPAACIGHSVGEYVAATLAGVFSLADALTLVAARAKLVNEQPGGAMLAARISEDDALEYMSDTIALAAVNGPKLCVLAGPDDAITALESSLSARGIPAKRLETSHAFHSPMMDPVIAPLAELAGTVSRNAPTIPVISTVTGELLTDAQATDPQYWARHAREAVRFSPAIAALLAGEHHLFLECGPGLTLTQLARQHRVPDRVVLGSIREGEDEATSIRSAAAQLWACGGELDWTALNGGRTYRRLSLPTYPFERKRYFADAPTSVACIPQQPRPSAQQQSEPTPQIAMASASDSAEPRAVRLTAEIVTALESLSGSDLKGFAPSLSFIELGFDSLFLTQAAVALFKRFGIKVTFRQLLQDFPTPESLAAHLDASLPADASIATPTEPATAARAGAPPPPPTATVRAAGPFRGIDRTSSEVTPEQRAHLEAFIAEYAARTAGSKAFTAEHRSHLADPRALAGFRRDWKELVYPLVCDRSEGAQIWDIDGNEYIDVTLGFGQILFGHRPPWLVKAMEDQLHKGIEIGPTASLAGTLARRLSTYLDFERVAFCNTGSEAVAAALRIARTVTGRDYVAVFSGAYHGIFDEVLFRPGPVPIAPGIPQSAVQNLIVLEYGTDESLAWLRDHAHELAAVMVEPVQSRRPSLAPREFLQEIRKLTHEAGTALIMDEIVTGFRVAPRGAQEVFGIHADIATYGKVIGGGMPIGIVAGSARFMDALDGGAWNYGDDSFPEVGVTFFAGTFVRHPLMLAAASAVLEQFESAGPSLQNDLAEKAVALVARMNGTLERHGVPLRWEQFSSMYHLPLPSELHFAPLLFHHMRARGIHAWENRPCFLSLAHSEADIARVAEVFEDSVEALVSAGLLPGKCDTGSQAVEHRGTGIAPDAPIARHGACAISLTDPQQEIHLATRLGADASAAFHDAIRLTLHGPIDAQKLSECLGALVARHEALRTTFAPDGTAQTVHPTMSCDIAKEDFSAEPPDVRQTKMDALAESISLAPFDLESGPLFRACLIKLTRDEHAFVFCAHHIVCDGWSFGLIAHELSALYRNEPPKQPALNMRAYARTQRDGERTPGFANAEKWWLAQFATPPAPLDLPTDRVRPLQRTFNAATRTLDLPAELCAPLRKLAAAQRATIFTVLLGGFYALLHRLSGQSDLVVGIPSAGQAQLDAPLVGHCVNFLPLRLTLDNAESLAGLLPRINNLVLDAQERQQVTFGRLLQMLRFPREQGRMPLVNVSFNVDRDGGALDFGGAYAELMPVEKFWYHLELSFNLVDHAGGYRLFCNFNRDLFDPGTITRWLGHYSTLLTGIADRPDTPVGELPILSPAESARMLAEWNDTTRGYPRDTAIDALFEDRAAQEPSAIAIIDSDRTLTYGELNSQANMLAHRILESGATPHSFIGICLERSAELIIAELAVLKARCAYVPLDPSWPEERLRFMAKDGGLVTTITKSAHARPFAKATTQLDGPQPVLSPSGENPGIPGSGDDPAYVMYTSGSTGTPKGVVIPHRAIARLVVNTDYVRLTANDVTGHVSNPAFDAATFEVWGALLNGGRIAVIPKETMLEPANLAVAIRDNGITAMFVTSALFNRIAAIAPDTFALLRHLLVGGDALNPASIRAVLASKPPQRLLNGYGPTETTTFAVTHHITEVPDDASSIPIGKPIANTTAYVLDRHMRPVPVGVAGELYLGGDGVALGYHERPDLTAEKFVPNPFLDGTRLYRTGDLARWCPDGTIDFLGRMDGQVKLRGFRVELGEIEAELLRHHTIRDAAVIVVTSTTGDKTLVAYFVSDAADPPATGELATFLRQRLPDYMVPSAYVALEALPLTANGKLDRRKLPRPDAVAEQTSIASADPTVRRVAEMMAAALGVKQVTPDDDFFRLGGHSLLAMDLTARLKAEFGVAITASQLFAGPNAVALAALIATDKASAKNPPQQVNKRSFDYLVPIQQGSSEVRPLFLVAGGWGGEIEFLVYAPIAQQLDPAQPIFGLKAKGAGTGAPPHADVAEMAADYIREICAVQPRGPYRIAGECVGGICAHEIACQLRESGEEVELLILLDTSVPNPNELADYLASEDAKQETDQFTPTLGGRFRHHLGKMSSLSIGDKARYLFDKTARAQPAGDAPPAQHPRGQATYPTTLMRHTLRPYTARVTLLVDQESYREYGALGWQSGATGEVETHILPGTHISYIREHSESAARKLRELLRQKPTPL